MQNLKARILGLLIIIIFGALIYFNWHQLLTESKYSLKLAALGPLGVIGGLYILAFPSKSGKPTTTNDKLILLIIFVVGILAGLVNWYLMDPAFFSR